LGRIGGIGNGEEQEGGTVGEGGVEREGEVKGRDGEGGSRACSNMRKVK